MYKFLTSSFNMYCLCNLNRPTKWWWSLTRMKLTQLDWKKNKNTLDLRRLHTIMDPCRDGVTGRPHVKHHNGAYPISSLSVNLCMCMQYRLRKRIKQFSRWTTKFFIRSSIPARNNLLAPSTYMLSVGQPWFEGGTRIKEMPLDSNVRAVPTAPGRADHRPVHL